MTASHRKLWPAFLLFCCCLAGSPVLAQEKLARTFAEANTQLAGLLLKEPWALLFAFFTIYPLLIFAAWIMTRLVRWAFSVRSFAPVPWKGKELLLFGLGYFLLQPLGYGLMRRLIPGGQLNSLATKMLFYCCLNIAFCGGLLCWLRYLAAPDAKQLLGWQAPGAKGVAAVAVGYLLFIPWFFLAFVMANLLFVALDVKPQPQAIAQEILQVRGIWLWVGIVTMVIVAPLSEEILFRMFLYSGLRRLVKPEGAMVLSAAIFAVVHQNAMALLPIFVLGIFFAWLYEKSQSLWVPTLAHGLHNGLTLIYLLNFL